MPRLFGVRIWNPRNSITSYAPRANKNKNCARHYILSQMFSQYMYKCISRARYQHENICRFLGLCISRKYSQALSASHAMSKRTIAARNSNEMNFLFSLYRFVLAFVRLWCGWRWLYSIVYETSFGTLCVFVWPPSPLMVHRINREWQGNTIMRLIRKNAR